jgi:elongation factor P
LFPLQKFYAILFPMLAYNEVTTGKVIVFNNEPCKVLSHHVFRMQQRKPVNATKLKGLKTGKMIEYSFHQNENIDEATLEKKPVIFIYESKGEYIFHETGNPSKRFPLTEDLIGSGVKFLKQKGEYQAVLFEEEIIGLEIPVKATFVVKEAAPAVRGNTAQGATKTVILETGATITTPLFINTGDIVEVNTESGEYAGRIEKA